MFVAGCEFDTPVVEELHIGYTRVCGDSAPSTPTVKKWASEFKKGRKSLEDDPREGLSTPRNDSENYQGYIMLEDKRVKELRTAFGYDTADLGDNLVPDTFNVLLNKLLREESKSGYVLQTANSILASRTLTLVPEFKREVGLFYKASVFEDDFENYPVEVLHRINKWVREETHGKINHLLDRLSPSAKMIVLNAMYFKGAWMVKFPKENTQDRLFYNYGLQSEAKYVPMMHLNTRFRYAEMDSYDMLELPFEMRNITMLLLLPRERNGLPALEESLTLEELSEAQRRLYFAKVDVYLPKFKLEYSKELSDEIKELGARSIFNAEYADFSGITPSKNVSISEVIHKAMIEVNEMGSEAAAVTGIATFRMSLVRDDVPLIMADHPFMLLLLENRRMVFFMARVAVL
ncbi:serpin B8 [Trichonephila clavipes]|nr:serpin B8 [Trichonephila clavipes]